MIEEQKIIAVPSDQLLPMQCYVQPFWKHSDIEIYNESNLDTMGRMPDSCIDLTVTSPPYDNLRKYKGYSFDFENIAKELYRVTKPGGVLVWVVGDSVVNGSETLTSFKQAIYFQSIGFNIHDTMIYAKENPIPLTHNRYEQQFEYMFVFSKGKPKTFNGIYEKTNGGIAHYNAKTKEAAARRNNEKIKVKDRRLKYNIWEYCVSNNDNTLHPAPFPEKLAADHIYSWSNEGDLVYDCFGGSGTACKMAHLQNRKCIMSEMSREYCEISVKRITPYVLQQRMSF